MSLVECVPNFSEGRDPGVIAAIRDAIAGTPGAHVLDVSSDPSHHRTVITFVASLQAAVPAAHRQEEQKADEEGIAAALRRILATPVAERRAMGQRGRASARARFTHTMCPRRPIGPSGSRYCTVSRIRVEDGPRASNSCV